MAKLTTILVCLLGMLALALLGYSLCSDFFAWYHRVPARAYVEANREHKAKGMLMRKSNKHVKRIYRIRFRNHSRTFSMYQEMQAGQGDSVSVLYSPRFPRNFKIKKPSIWWIGLWMGMYVLATPFFLFYGFLFMRSQFQDQG